MTTTGEKERTESVDPMWELTARVVVRGAFGSQREVTDLESGGSRQVHRCILSIKARLRVPKPRFAIRVDTWDYLVRSFL